MALQITAARPDPELLELPWHLPLAQWPHEVIEALPRGISRHVVRFVRLGSGVIAVKEIHAELARREYRVLLDLHRLGEPAVSPMGVVSGRTGEDGRPLDACLLTRHLTFSLPYRAVYSQQLRPDTTRRLTDALAVLLVRLHLAGLYWGDVSLSNTLFRRDAGELAAYLVDAETAELHDTLSDGQRAHDLDTAHGNIAGELMDLEAGGLLDPAVDPLDTADRVRQRYEELWEELTGRTLVQRGERWLVEARIRRLNELGFDVGELQMSTDVDGTHIALQPKIVDAGHHSRRLLRLTGLQVGENQARRLLNDLDSYAASQNRQADEEERVAHDWLSQIWEPITRTVPAPLRDKLEPAEVFHEVLVHRWYLSERAGHDVTIEHAIRDYVEHVLPHKPSEALLLGPRPGEKHPDHPQHHEDPGHHEHHS